jgi:polar amino acid transport system substrate-binding protein
LKTGLVTAAKNIPGSRILDGQFTGIQQAIATKNSNLASIQFLSACVQELISTGLVTALIQKYGVEGLSAAPVFTHS